MLLNRKANILKYALVQPYVVEPKGQHTVGRVGYEDGISNATMGKGIPSVLVCLRDLGTVALRPLSFARMLSFLC